MYSCRVRKSDASHDSGSRDAEVVGIEQAFQSIGLLGDGKSMLDTEWADDPKPHHLAKSATQTSREIRDLAPQNS
jgi:hypothetical protein